MNLTKIKTTDTKVHNIGNPKFTEIEDRNGTTFFIQTFLYTSFQNFIDHFYYKIL